ncbi:hypothetical protein [Mucilaginibacter psychrotolerans]|uniref:Uncharacterized protein n=1 Tax=Mucilaginibacter psychrotolerans TaxID=1524096 RepID=A0A4Y8S8W1_9SPHI|nr:hypothetical protein [Mucilaginibacter psychrotolerans]TFF35543.1 hypothetical protein E2R66_18845 [Mucilaginibacter psychrotolerans]
MKILSIILLSLFSLQLQAQQNAKDMADARAKLQALTAMTQAPQGKTAGKITYIVNGKTYTESNGISTVIINGKIGDIANAKHSVSIGDGTAHIFKVGQSYSCKF